MEIVDVGIKLKKNFDYYDSLLKTLYKKENIIKLKEMYDVDVQIVQDENCPASKFNIKVLRKFKDFKDDED